jgi:PAS domain-containing protein
MTANWALPLNHSWPLWEQPRHFELGHVLNSAVSDLIEPARMGQLGFHHAGCWDCDLKDNKLTWSGGVYDIFGLQRWAPVRREEAVALYSERSRTIMERLRAHAIRHRRGFTVDVEILPATGERRWIRLIAAPVCVGRDVIRLHGLKLVI